MSEVLVGYGVGCLITAILVGLVAGNDVDRVSVPRVLALIFLWPVSLAFIFGSALRR